MKRTICMLFGLALAPTAVAQEAGVDPTKEKAELTDPVEILRKVDAAARAVKVVKYTAKSKGLLAAEARTPVAEGTAILSGYAAPMAAEWYFDIKVQRPGSAETDELSAGSDGDMFYLVDKAAKIAYEDIDPAVLGRRGQIVQRSITMIEFVHPTPFSDEINGRSQELKGITKVGDEECYEIHVAYAQGNQEAHWFVSTKDFLPRRVDRFFTAPDGGRQGTQLILTSLTVDPKFDKSPFKLALPEGFTKTDDFAP